MKSLFRKKPREKALWGKELGEKRVSIGEYHK